MERKFMQTEWRKRYLLMDMTTVDVKNWLEKTDTVIQPVGSCEQHGLHMPLGTDAYTAMLVACGAAEKADVPIAPLIWSGYTPYHMGKPGTITLRRETFENLFYDICRSLIHHGFNKIVISAGHHANFPIINDVSRRIRYETGALVISFYRGEVANEIGYPMYGLQGFKGTRHGGEMETSGVLCWNPDLVQIDKAKEHKIKLPEWLNTSFEPYKVGEVKFKGYPVGIPLDHYEICEQGNLGNPTIASREKAEKIFSRVMEIMAELLLEVKKLKLNVKNREFIDRV